MYLRLQEIKKDNKKIKKEENVEIKKVMVN